MTSTTEINADTTSEAGIIQEDSTMSTISEVETKVSTSENTETFTTVLTPEPAATTEPGGSGSWIGCIGIGLAIGVGIVSWKLSEKVSKEIKDLRCRLDKRDRAMRLYATRMEELESEIHFLKQSLDSQPQQSTVRIINPQPQFRPEGVVKPEKVIKQEEQRHETKAVVEKPKKRSLQVKYATLQSPAESGMLRFAERGMVDSPSEQKMFMIELDPQDGIGIYRINPAAINLILSDLQMFRDFVKPFTFSGDPMHATIRDKVPGKITRRGNFWIVDEPLEISIS